MARLEISLLGPFETTLDGDPVTAFETDAARALLAFLAAEPGRSWPRPVVAEMLWPERPEGAALSNLRHVLAVLRRAVGDLQAERPSLLTDRGTLALDASTHVWVDLVEFEALAQSRPDTPGAVEGWERAVELWRGPLLEGLKVRAGAQWEEWLVVTEERARRHLATALRRLADHQERAGSSDLAISSARRLTEVDVWDERAHRQLMRLLARTGERNRAISHYERLQGRLLAELDAAPAPETAALADQIRAGDLASVSSEVEIAYPDFLGEKAAQVPPLFVGRQRELDFLKHHLDTALAGQGRALFLAGEAGSGKTMLAGEFMRRATAVPELLVARGRCNSFGGLGDPYLPFRELLSLLCGDVESSYTAGALDREQATRLWEAISHSGRLVSELAPSLLGVMVNGGLLVDRAEQAVPGLEWVESLRARVETFAQRPPIAERMQPALFDEYTGVLERLSITRPLLLVVDDLQWADTASIALLWHLARRIEGMRVLVVGAYRPEEVTPRLSEVLHDLQTRTPDCVVALDNEREFIDEFLDSEPNVLDTEFRDRLFSYTGGQPLFTVELVRGMQERAEIRRDRAGVWGVQGSLDWNKLPSRVEAVITQRIARLPDDLRSDLTVASVQGEEFIAEVVAVVRSDEDAPARLSRESANPHRLIEPSGVSRIDGRLVSGHRFRHVLFQRYLYDRIGQSERVRLHEETGRALEDLHRDGAEPPVLDLARHFDEAGLAEPTIGYLHRAAQRAIQMSAAEGAIPLLERALTLLKTVPDSAERDRRELELLGSLASSLFEVRGYAAPEAQSIGPRVRELCDRLDPSPTTAIALLGLASVLSVRGLYRQSQAVCQEAISIGEELDDPALRVVGYRVYGYNQTFMGDLAAGHESLQVVRKHYDPQAHAWLTYAFPGAPGPESMVWDAVNILHRGYPDQARALADEGISLARATGHPFTLCHCLAVGGAVLRQMGGDHSTSQSFTDEVEAIAGAEHFPFFEVAAALYRGRATGYLGDPETGIELVTGALDAWQAMGVGAFRGWFLGSVAEFEGMRGRTAYGLQLVESSLRETRDAGERLTEAYLLVWRGGFLDELGEQSAENACEEALALARAIGARLLEVQAATRLATMYVDRGEMRQAERVLAPIYSWFTEGLETPHLVKARSVLEQL